MRFPDEDPLLEGPVSDRILLVMLLVGLAAFALMLLWLLAR